VVGKIVNKGGDEAKESSPFYFLKYGLSIILIAKALRVASR
jgi:hypothetical protein